MTRLNPFNGESTDRGVSPVIGVILMVAITVILAAVIGSFVLGIGGDQETTPQATFDVDTDTDESNISIRKSGGPTLDTGDLSVIVENTSDGETIRYENLDSEDFRTADTLIASTDDGEGNAGQTLSLRGSTISDDDDVDGDEFELESGTDYRVTIVHNPSDGAVLDRTVTA